MSIRVGGIYDRIHRDNDIESGAFLQVNCCGIYERATENSGILRPNGRSDYQLILIADGSAVFFHSGREITLASNEMLLIPPGVRNDYHYSNDVHAMWIHFTGTAVPALLAEYDLDPFTCYGISGTGPFFALADQIIREFRLRHVGYANNCSGLLLQMLTLAKRRIDAEYEAEKRRQSLDLTPVIEDMKTHFDESRDISVYAKMCSVSVSHFTHCFTKEFGVPPIKYLFSIRIEQAKYLLAETRLPVHEVASSVGFEDPLYFSRIFKKHIGIPPGQYRRMWHEKLSAQKNP